MVEKIVLKGRGAVKGMGEGEALVVPTHIHTVGLDARTGQISEVGHPQRGMSVKGKVLVFGAPAGSSDWGATLFSVCRRGNGPVALICPRAVTMVLNGAIAASIPMVVDLDKDPRKVIKTGDLIKVDADKGIVEIHKPKKPAKS
jgi:predicted aconitase with swiveling domain